MQEAGSPSADHQRGNKFYASLASSRVLLWCVNLDATLILQSVGAGLEIENYVLIGVYETWEKRVFFWIMTLNQIVRVKM